MTVQVDKERFRQRFCSDEGFIVFPKDGGEPSRLDGQPLTEVDKKFIKEAEKEREKSQD